MPPDCRGRVGQSRELPGRDHARFVDDEHAPLGERPVVDVAEQRGDARALDPGVVLELACGAAGDRDAEHGVAGGLPRLAGGGERERLARPGLADHHAHAVAVQAQPLDHQPLLSRERRP